MSARPVGASERKLDGGDTNIVALVRDEHMLVPNAATILEAGDRLVVVASETGLQLLRANLLPW
jgi:Trk K+ transport system NAD-binding subunit